MYLPSKDHWFPMKPMPTVRAAPICAVLKNRYIIALGGVGNDPPQAPSNAVEIFDIVSSEWTKHPGMTEPLMGMASLCRADDKLLIFGGMKIDTNPTDESRCILIEEKEESKEVEVLWRALPFMPTARYAADALGYEKQVAVIGGRVGKTPIANFEVFDTQQNLWKIFPELPGKRVFTKSLLVSDRLFILGGLHQPATQGFSSSVDFFDMTEGLDGKWRKSKNMSFKRGDFMVAAFEPVEETSEKEIVVVGGLGTSSKNTPSSGAAALTHCESLQISSFNGPKRSWKLLPHLPYGRATATSIICDGNLYIIGGILAGANESEQGPTSKVEKLKL